MVVFKESLLELCRSALEYLDNTKGISAIKEKCKFYADVQDKAFFFSVDVYPPDLLEQNAILGGLVLHHPIRARQVFREVIYAIVTSLHLLPIRMTENQIAVTFKLLSLPSLPGYCLATARELFKHPKTSRFVHYEGIVCGISTVHKYTKSARFTCLDENCFGSEENRFIRLHIPGATEMQTIRKDFKCCYCGAPLVEDISARVLADKVIIELVDADTLDVTEKKHCQSITTYLRDDLVTHVEIGQKLTVIGLTVFDCIENRLALEGNNILHDRLLSKESQPEIEPAVEKLPPSIRLLHADRKCSPWSFGLSLAYAFGGSISPAGTFLHLKLGILLSLVGSISEEAGGLDLLAVGRDTLLLHRLLAYGTTFSPRHIMHSTGYHLTAAVLKDKHNSGACFVEGGSILLAGHGVCLIPELSSLKKVTRHNLMQVLETNCVRVNIPAKMSQQGVQQLVMPRKCRIWAYTDPVAQKKPQHFEDLEEKVQIGSTEVQLLAEYAQIAGNCILKSKNVLGGMPPDPSSSDPRSFRPWTFSLLTPMESLGFGMVYFADLKPDTYADHMNVHQTLLNAAGTQPFLYVNDKDFLEYLQYAGRTAVSLSVAAEKMIQCYYVASRRTKSASREKHPFPITAVKTITSLASAHAKLNIRQDVTEQDALMAIYLYEESITNRYGYSVMNVKPLPHVLDNNTDDYIGSQWDRRMYQFKEQLKHFLATYATDFDSTMEE